ncbi:MAG: T9SS type A sorting domain-containing protein [Bacteroidales bacterium]|nr:T9SS type A sorting domain-containing protein [Bacteroidales bacterium]
MKSTLTSLLILITLALTAQVVTTNPSFPLINEPVTIIFDATQGDGGMVGYTGDVYAYTGLIMDYSGGGTDWKYVKANWGTNTPACKMTRIGVDLYQIQFQPSIRAFYGVPADENILKMAFVFRSATQVGGQWITGRDVNGADIFVDVFDEGLNVTFLKPFSFPLITILNESFPVEVVANEADSVWLFVDDELISKSGGNYLTDTLVALNYGKFNVKAVAGNEEGTVADSFYYYVRKPVEIKDLPDNVRDGINYPDASSVVLSLVAPGKEYIYVIGDFNDWEVDSNFYMKQTPDGERFWLEINDLIPGKEYIFQYFIDGVIRVGDPYADKISDPWNDQYISNATYPDLIQYPAGKTTGIATVLQTNQQPYQWEVENFTPPAVTDLVIYELLVRDFTSKHSYAALIDSLDYLESLGINAIELMPVNEFEGNISWGYNPSFYFAPDKYYGPKNELKRFIDKCHKRGIAVFLDLVLNHAYDQCPLVQMYFDGSKPAPDNPWFNVDHNFGNPEAHWGNDFNHESLYTQAFIDSVNSYWMREYKFDGFRFDFTKGFGNNYKDPDTDPWGSLYDADRIRLLKRMADEIWERKADAIIIFEHLAVNAEDKELADYGILMWGNLNEKYAEAAMGYHESGKSNFSGISYKLKGWNDPHLVGYMESHDEERVAYKCITWGNSMGEYNIMDSTITLQRLAMNALFFFTVPGPKMIWQFGELGYDYSIDYNGRTGPKPIRWDYLDNYRRKYLSDFYGALIKLRIQHPAFQTTDFTLNVAPALKKMVLEHPEMDVVVVGNFDLQQGSINPGFTHTGTWYEYFTGQSLDVTNLAQPMTLQAGEYRLYTNVRLETPQIGTGLHEILPETGMLRVFPNPSRLFNIELEMASQSEAVIEIYDITGRKAGHVFDGRLAAGNHTIQWFADHSLVKPGLYLLRVMTPDRSDSVRLVID